jgi:hypothetical protein
MRSNSLVLVFRDFWRTVESSEDVVEQGVKARATSETAVVWYADVSDTEPSVEKDEQDDPDELTDGSRQPFSTSQLSQGPA